MPTVTLTPPSGSSKPYPIIVEPGALKKIPMLVSELGSYDSVVILSDAALKNVVRDIKGILPHAHVIDVPSGEASKSLREVERITHALLEVGATRQTLLINVGGGMLTDLGGFMASIYMRGVDCVHVPTSLLGMVDAAIGGKTGVDLGSVKNILGRFHHPRAVVADIDVLQTLSDDQFKEGLVEVIKMAAMLDAALFSWLEGNLPQILARETAALTRCIEGAVQMKATAVQEDEKDAGKRLFLNFGHTVGHALEALSDFSISHGKAVSMGMVKEMHIAGSKGAERIVKLLTAIAMPTEIPHMFSSQDIWEAMQSDKKKLHNTVRIAVPKTIGEGILLSITQKDILQDQQ